MTEVFSRIDAELCTGCGTCAETCPSEAISGEKNQPQVISEQRCLACSRCVQVCNAYDSIFQQCPTARAGRLAARRLPARLAEPLFAAHDLCLLEDVRSALSDPSRTVLLQCGPMVCDTIAEEFGLASGSLPPGRLVSALRRAGFGKIYDFTLAAALAVAEQARELAARLQSGRGLPLINSSCPAAVKFIEQSHQNLIGCLSASKSPHQIAGALLKSRVARKLGLDPREVYSVSVGPCAARKFEARRPEMAPAGFPDVDAVLTVRELGYLLKDSGIDPAAMAEEGFDAELAHVEGMQHVYAGPGDITRAVLEAVRRLLGADAQQDGGLRLEETGVEGVRTAEADLGTYRSKVVVASGLKTAASCLGEIGSGGSAVAFVELLACPAGCASGGGQPKILLPQDRQAGYESRARLHAQPSKADVLEVSKRFLADLEGSGCVLHTQYTERRLSS